MNQTYIDNDGFVDGMLAIKDGRRVPLGLCRVFDDGRADLLPLTGDHAVRIDLCAPHYPRR